MGNYPPHSSFLSGGYPRGVLVGPCYGCVSLVINLTLCTTIPLMDKIPLEAVKDNNQVQGFKVNMEVRHVESLLDM